MVQLLDSLRSRIRWYVVVEGLAALVIWLVGAFWIGLALDYLPVLVGANEMPRVARTVLLAIVALGGCGVIYWYILRRVFSTFRDTSLALLIEKQFPGFRDSLVTTVEMGERRETDVEKADRLAIEAATVDSAGDASELNAEMFAQTIGRAEEGVRGVQLSRVFSYRPLAVKLGLAIVAVGSLVAMGAMGREALGIGASRLLLMSDEPWPRRSRIELVGFEAGELKLARGTDLILRVRADANREYPPPELCTILYETYDGDRGRVNMSRDGDVRDGYQFYVFNGKPFKSVLNDIEFDVIGGDFRLRDNRIRVVASPVVTAVHLHSELPAYTGLLPRDETWSPGVQLPIGSKITAKIETSKDVTQVRIRNIDSDEEQVFDFSAESATREVAYEVGELSGRYAVVVHLLDTDGIESLEPYLLSIGAVLDEIPKVDVSLRGISNAITAKARLAIEGSVTDDYEVARSWFDLKVGDTTREFEFDATGDLADAALDLRRESATARENPYQLKPEDRVVFTIRASDKYDLGGESHLGSSEATTLTVVRDDELLAILDGRELNLRRRFEQIRSEMMQSRDSLGRLRASFREEAEETEPALQEGIDPEVAERNLWQLRDRWASWAGQKSEQTVFEVDGVALAFEDIREELINNRVDTPERLSRMENEIIAPLRDVADLMFPKYRESIRELRAALSTSDASSEPRSIDVTAEADQIIVAMDAILEKMIELEDYAELLNIVRQMIEQQESLIQKAKDEQKAGVLDLFK